MTAVAYEPETMQIIIADWVTPPMALGYRPVPSDDADPDESYVGDGLSDGGVKALGYDQEESTE